MTLRVVVGVPGQQQDAQGLFQLFLFLPALAVLGLYHLPEVRFQAALRPAGRGPPAQSCADPLVLVQRLHQRREALILLHQRGVAPAVGSG